MTAEGGETEEGTGADALEAGRWLFAQPCEFMLGVTTLRALPDTGLPEVAFAGRSNVGKSSLVNALTGRKTLARTSNTPGRTKELNFFALGPAAGAALILVDLPGYGYARETKSRVAQWTALIIDYLRGRPELRRVFVLVDSRHGLKDSDRDVMSMLDEVAVSYQIVLTKIDKLKKNELESRIEEIRAELKKHPASHPVIHATSSEKGTGIAELRAELASLADEAALGYKPQSS
ncbi:MAG: ribosome biogenesis GTP-binding protein YihA/YsxC [Alphaproteobacteria bacterium]